MSTLENLMAAFAGESQANRKYLAFAEKAAKEGWPQIARLFRAAAAAETVHAHAHLRAAGGVQTTAENLQTAVEGEGHEFRSMYPPYVEEARREGNKAAEVSFRNALVVEEIHHDLYLDALRSLNNGADLPNRRIFVCEVCGNTVMDEAPQQCPVCGVAHEKFFEIS